MINLAEAAAGSHEWWFGKLQAGLSAKKARLDLLAAYACGDSPLMEISESVRPAYVDFQRRARTNYAGLSVAAMLDLIHPAAIRTGAQGDELGDELAWDWWQANQLDADSPVLFRSVFEMGEAYAIVDAVDAEIGAPLVSIEDPRTMSGAVDPRRRRALRAARKEFRDEWTGRDHAYLYLRGDVAGTGGRAVVRRAEREAGRGWAWIEDPQPLKFAQLPVVWFPNQLDIDGKTTWGEFEQHTDVIDRINTTTLQRLVITAMQAFRQRLLKGLPLKDELGNLIDYDGMFAADPAALWMVPEGVEIWESAATDISPILHANRDDVKDFAAVTRTPLPALSPDAANQTTANSDLVKSGHLGKCLDRMAALSEPLEQVVNLMFMQAGDLARARRRDMEILWAPPDIPPMAERFDAAAKATAAGVPEAHVMLNIVGMSPQEIRRMAATAASQVDPAVPAMGE